MISPEELQKMFTYHQPTGEQQVRYQNLRTGALTFARIILANTKPSADQTAAIRKLRECIMTANQSVALE